MNNNRPIGIFDSGYGGLTVMKEIVKRLPGYDYIYLGDNARAPYGPRSFETVYRYTLQSVQWFFKQNCPLVILACNTASAKALRTIQQNDLAKIDHTKRVLGVIRPTTEVIGNYSNSKQVGILATNGTVISGSYPIEIEKFFPGVKVFQQACPMWVPLIESNEHHSKGADFFVKKYIHDLLQQSPLIDTILLACTHYPLIQEKIKEYSPADMTILSQGEIVAISLVNYLQRHQEMEQQISKNGQQCFYTTDSTEDFDNHATLFYGTGVSSKHVDLEAQ
ncbi:MAG: glutamate racemase [Sphingobacteriales bacterium]|nr:glutamate racemase [Sphingobacteriales bacterium]